MTTCRLLCHTTYHRSSIPSYAEFYINMSSESAAYKAGQCLLDLKQVLSNNLTPQILAVHNVIKRRLRLRLEKFLI